MLFSAHTMRFTLHEFSSTKKLKTVKRACMKGRNKTVAVLKLREGKKKKTVLQSLKSRISTTSPYNITTVIVGGNPLLVERIDFRHQVAHQQTLSCPAGKKKSHCASSNMRLSITIWHSGDKNMNILNILILQWQTIIRSAAMVFPIGLLSAYIPC